MVEEVKSDLGLLGDNFLMMMDYGENCFYLVIIIKIMNQEMLRKGLRLYYLILTVHRKKLPGKMRMLGDLYVKQ